ncbi:hypothetical protein O181_097457 [Austropuccinia psidii MF-1]|uniref:Uncharacterized protein n=1 Tax=Austropuccinia psidii MF-1 TaxID=1389203 RepID=A0A9Q3J8K9_9BASI|nr:hypothetical protein [Austropuccinia psidii MF-1]
MTGPACSLCVLIVGQPHAFIQNPRRVIHRQLSHAWKTFYSQSSNRLFSWSAGQLDCRSSPARAWKPEANQCGFSSASSALEESRPMFAWGSPTAGHFLQVLTGPAHVVAPGLQPKKSLGKVASFSQVSYTREAKTVMSISVD